MVTNSGIVLDYTTNVGIFNAKVVALTSSGAVLATVSTDPCGVFSANIGEHTGEVIYIPVKENYGGLTKQHKSYIPWIDLYLLSSNDIQPSGISYINSYNLPLSTSSRIRNAVSNKVNLYAITEGGLDIIDLNTYTNVGYINYSGGFTAIDFYTNEKIELGVLLGTSNSGVCEFIFPATYDIENRDKTFLLKTKFKSDSILYDIQSDKVDCISRNYFNDLIIGTESGVDYYSRSGVHYYHSYGSNIGTTCCHITDSGDLYYSPANSGIYIKFNPILDDWFTVDYIVEVGGTPDFGILTNKINNIDVKTISGENYIYLATASGVLWYKELKTDLNLTANEAKIYNEI